MNIQIITDSASDIVNSDRKDLTVLPMTITFGETEFLDGITLTHEEFFERLIESDALPTTSQISPFAFSQALQKATQDGSCAIVITMSGKLSGTYQSACIAAEEFEGKAFVVDSENVTVGERALIEYALRLKDEGRTPEEIVQELNLAKKRIQLIALLDTLEYLKKGRQRFVHQAGYRNCGRRSSYAWKGKRLQAGEQSSGPAHPKRRRH